MENRKAKEGNSKTTGKANDELVLKCIKIQLTMFHSTRGL